MARSNRTLRTTKSWSRFQSIVRDVEAQAAPVSKAAEPVPPDIHALYNAMVTDEDLRSVTARLFRDGYFAHAVEDAFKLVNNRVKASCGKLDGRPRDGKGLMMHAFNEDDPVLRLNSMKTVSHRDEQEGYKFMFAGGMVGIRNPRAHEHLLRDEGEAALEMLVIANHLMRVARRAKRTRKRKSDNSLRGSRTPRGVRTR